jgi:RNA polymerase sigma-70 factor (ECF subfamily)
LNYKGMSPEQLALVCSESRDAGAWEEFVHRFHRVIASAALRTARRWNENSPHLIDEVVQEVYLKLFSDDARLLREFKSKHPDAVYGYLKVLTVNVAHDYFKASHAAKRGGGETPESVEFSDDTPSSRSAPANLERAVLLSEIDDCLSKHIPRTEFPRSRLIFWLYYRVGLSAAAIASYPTVGLTTKGVESVLLRLTRLLRETLAGQSGRSKRPNEPSQVDEGAGQV